MLKNKCCLYVIISIRFFSITICNLLIEFPSYIPEEGGTFLSAGHRWEKFRTQMKPLHLQHHLSQILGNVWSFWAPQQDLSTGPFIVMYFLPHDATRTNDKRVQLAW